MNKINPKKSYVIFLTLIMAAIYPSTGSTALGAEQVTKSKNQLPSAITQRKGWIKETAPGPYQAQREGIRNWLMEAKKKGVGINGYLTVYNDMEQAVEAGKPDSEVKDKLDRIQRSIGDQYTQSRKLQSPSRKITSKGSKSQKSDKVDINYGRNRYWTPHEIKKSVEIAERNAIQRIPDYLRNDEEVRQDLRRQRDEREKQIMIRHGFTPRGFTRNPGRYIDTGRMGGADYGTYRYGNH